jgi:hypothetical protein
MNPNAPAFSNPLDRVGVTGLTIRDYIAIEAMKGLIPTANIHGVGEKEIQKDVARFSYQFADALIAESNKKN